MQSRRVRALLCAALLAVGCSRVEQCATSQTLPLRPCRVAADPASMVRKCFGSSSRETGCCPSRRLDLQARSGYRRRPLCRPGDGVTSGQALAELQGREELQAPRVAAGTPGRRRTSAARGAEGQRAANPTTSGRCNPRSRAMRPPSPRSRPIRSARDNWVQRRRDHFPGVVAMESPSARLTERRAGILDARRAAPPLVLDFSSCRYLRRRGGAGRSARRSQQARLREGPHAGCAHLADGRILAVHAHPGQRVGADGVATFGKDPRDARRRRGRRRRPSWRCARPARYRHR